VHQSGSRASALYADRPALLADLLRTYIRQQSLRHATWWPHQSGEQRLIEFIFTPVPPDYLICTVADRTPTYQFDGTNT
jgi:hypothetical protein